MTVAEDQKKRGKHPLVTVGLPTYNGGKKIITALRSVFRQNYSNLEVIISDNCSTDNTMEICMSFGKQFGCIRYFRQPHNIGLMPNFEFVLSQASGELFMWISDDDTLEPGVLRKYVDFLIHHPDYSLVSGEIRYLINETPVFCERDFNFTQDARVIRFLTFYFKVVYGSIFYGLMRTSIAKQIPLKNRIGDDWHFVAGVAYHGKIKNLDCIGYNKRCGGLSRDFNQYSKAIGATSFASRFPHLQIARDAFSNVLHESPVYAQQPYLLRVMLAFSAFSMIITSHYGKLYPLILGGRLKRWLGLRTSLSRYRVG
jgi:glycosyltransferase involved in cell wall biosynthesis